MAIKETCNDMKCLLDMIREDLEKAEQGNKAAAQRVRTNSIKFEKAAKRYRKESIHAPVRGGKKKAAAKKMPSQAARKPMGKRSAAKPMGKPIRGRKEAPVRAKKPASVSPSKKTAKAKTMARKRPTAKLPKPSKRR